MNEDQKLNRSIIASNIDRHPVGKQLTSAAREIAIRVGLEAFKGWKGNGPAAEIGIKAATAGVLQ